MSLLTLLDEESGFYVVGNPESKNLLPLISIQVDFDTDPTATPRTWTNITQDVRELRFQRAGRNNELGRTEAGTLTGVLSNRNGYYDPVNTSGPYYPNVKRMRWIRVRAFWNGTTYARWQGLIETWMVRWPGFGADSIVEIRATDPFKILNLYSLNGNAYGSQQTYQRVQDVLDDVGLPYVVDTTATDTLVSSGTLSATDMALQHLLAVEETENGLLFARGDGSIEFQSRHYRATNSGTVTATIGDGAGETPYRDAAYETADDDIWNYWAVTPSGGTAHIASDSSSITAYYQRPRTRDLLVTDGNIATDAATALVLRYADPKPRVTELELIGMGNPTLWDSILALKNSDRVTWKRRAGYATITDEFYVERVSDSIRPGEWTVTVELSPVSGVTTWKLDDANRSQLGNTTTLSY